MRQLTCKICGRPVTLTSPCNRHDTERDRIMEQLSHHATLFTDKQIKELRALGLNIDPSDPEMN